MLVRRGCTNVLIWLAKIVSIDAGLVSSCGPRILRRKVRATALCLGGRQRREELFQANIKASRENLGSRVSHRHCAARVERPEVLQCFS